MLKTVVFLKLLGPLGLNKHYFPDVFMAPKAKNLGFPKVFVAPRLKNTGFPKVSMAPKQKNMQKQWFS